MADKQLKYAGSGPLLYTSANNSAAEIRTHIEEVAPVTENKFLHDGMECTAWTGNRLLGTNVTKKTVSVNASDFLSSADDSVTITDASGVANLSVPTPTPTNNLYAKTYIVYFDSAEDPAFPHTNMFYIQAYQTNVLGNAYVQPIALVQNSCWYGFISGGNALNRVNEGDISPTIVHTFFEGSATDIMVGTTGLTNEGLRIYLHDQHSRITLVWIDNVTDVTVRFMLHFWKMQPPATPATGPL